ncbi:hypothetical protein L0657_13750 [Dyadobacter sp. CY345]|uniref:hypothetical protein n=1 Tax=Dyadobacter sp. CY345 TaxID=2909335 RepID=UPI001F36CEA0|nr:hypothetical protein [Dyadobacter sp. CY345]MCF2445026.1 hypothetical protein [Dyadobacter sp. CY345]
MKRKQLLSNTLCSALFAGAMLLSSTVFAQVKIGDNPTAINAGSALEIESTNRGLLMPRISLTNTTTWGLAGTAVAGMHVYNTNAAIASSNILYPTLVAKIGEYYWDGTGWVALAPALKTTTIASFSQSTPGVTADIPSSAVGTCGVGIGQAIPICAYNLNRNASFTVNNANNDVTVDITGTYSAAYNTTQFNFFLVLAIDKTTPGVFEAVDTFFFTHSGTGCSASYINAKTALQNYSPRTYNVRVYLLPWVNGGVSARVGVGKESIAGACGNNDFANQKVVVSVSQ